MPYVNKGMWEDMWNHDRPPLYFEPSIKTSKTWANLPGGRLIKMGDRSGKSKGFLFESQDGRSAIKVDESGVITYYSADYKISGVWDTKTGRAHLNLDTLQLRKTLGPKAFDIDGPGHPLRVEQEIERIVIA